MTGDRRRGVEIRPDGSRFDHSTMRMWLDQQDAARPRVTVERLSLRDPEIVAFEQTSRSPERRAR